MASQTPEILDIYMGMASAMSPRPEGLLDLCCENEKEHSELVGHHLLDRLLDAI
jgi:hypothetical protein